MQSPSTAHKPSPAAARPASAAPDATIIPILLYHGISSDPDDAMASFTVEPRAFARHLDLVLAAGFRCLTVSELVDAMADDKADLSDVALITFDDGYLDFLDNALPALRERSLASTMYVTTGYVDSPASADVPNPPDPIMSWAQIAALPDDAVPVEVGAHSHSHPQLDTLSHAQVRDELVRSKALLEDALGREVRSFAYPHGYNSPSIRRQTREAGYDSGAAVRNALSHPRDDVFRLARLTVRSYTEDAVVASWLAGRDAQVAPDRDSWKTVGWRLYRRTRSAGSMLDPVR